MEENNPFEEYYRETFPQAKKPEFTFETQKEDDTLDFLKEDSPKPKKELSPDAKVIRAPIGAFIKRIIAIIDVAFVEQKAKGTRPDLIMTMIIGGLAFIVANAYFLINRNLPINLTEEEYTGTFIKMFKSALCDIGKNP